MAVDTGQTDTETVTASLLYSFVHSFILQHTSISLVALLVSLG